MNKAKIIKIDEVLNNKKMKGENVNMASMNSKSKNVNTNVSKSAKMDTKLMTDEEKNINENTKQKKSTFKEGKNFSKNNGNNKSKTKDKEVKESKDAKKVTKDSKEISENSNVLKSKKAIANIKKKIDELDLENFDETEVTEILKMIDKELEKSTIKMAEENISDDELKFEADIYAEFVNLNKELLEKVTLSTPFESFFYSDDKDKEEMIKEFFKNINKEVHWLDLEDIDFNAESSQVITSKNNILSESLIDVLEDKLNVNFSEYQKVSLKKDFSDIASSMNDEFEEIIDECNKIKTVSGIKLISRPSYKNFISKAELKQHDPSKKLSTIRINFLNYITLKDKEKTKMINDSLEMQLKSIKEILEVEKEEIYKKLKVLFLLIALSLVVTTAAPTAGALGIITIGSAAAFMQSKIIMADNKIKRIDEEMQSIENGTSKLTEATFEKLNETTKELLSDYTYSEVADLYIKKKKNALKEKELKEKVEMQMRNAILENLNSMDSEKKEQMISKVKEKYNDIISKDKLEISQENEKDNLSFDVQLEL